MADALDRRAADFARRAFARLRYLQETSSALRERVQAVFHYVDSQASPGRINEIHEDLLLPNLGLTDAGILSPDSLFRPRLRRIPGELEPVGDDLTQHDLDEAMAELGANLRDTLNVLRANRYVERLPVPNGTRTPLAALPIANDDDIADIIACLLHAGARDAAFSLETTRVSDDNPTPPTVLRAGYAIEDFSIEKP